LAASLGQLLDLMRHHGASRIYAKKLAPNDNSKNQVYLGGDFSALNIIPHGNIYTDDAEVAGAVRDRAKAAVAFYWIDEAGRHHAPNTGLSTTSSPPFISKVARRSYSRCFVRVRSLRHHRDLVRSAPATQRQPEPMKRQERKDNGQLQQLPPARSGGA